MTALLRLSLVALAVLPRAAPAQMLQDQGPPLHRIVHKNTFAIRVNPLGLLYDGRFSYRLRLYQHESKALRDNFVGVGLAPTASPAFVRVGPFVEFNPLSVLGFWAAVQFVQYFGTFNLLQGFPGAQSDFSDSAITANGPTNRDATNGWELTIGATFQVKVSSIVVRSQARLVRGEMRLREGQRIYYDQFYDVGAPNGGFFFTNDLDVVWQGLDNKLIAGARYTFTTQFYEARHLDPNDPTTVNNTMHRVGPFFGYTFKIEDGAKFNTPTVFLLVQWWLQHRFRTGQDVSQAIPLFGVGFQTTGDFLSIK
jgi:hypothetical protein